jgi:polyphosphate kinase 2
MRPPPPRTLLADGDPAALPCRERRRAQGVAKKDKKKGKASEKAAPKAKARATGKGRNVAVATPLAAKPKADTPFRTDGKMSGKAYEAALFDLHVELVKLQEWAKATGAKVCVVFEGRDGAGKGGTIKAITERVSPRVFRVVALPAPTERQKSQMYIQRYMEHFPAAGEIVIFDRSWYNRAGVERVMGYANEAQVKRFLDVTPAVEKVMIESGIILLKYWLEVGMEEQTKRLSERIDDGRKIWKLSPMDLKSYSRWYDYSRARDAMFQATDTPWAPWYVVHSDDKKRARVNIIRHLLKHIPYEAPKREKVKLPKRQDPGDYVDPDYPFKLIADTVGTP